MTTEEKLQHFYKVSIESAKEEAAKAISQYRDSLEEELEKHKKAKKYIDAAAFINIFTKEKVICLLVMMQP